MADNFSMTISHLFSQLELLGREIHERSTKDKHRLLEMMVYSAENEFTVLGMIELKRSSLVDVRITFGFA